MWHATTKSDVYKGQYTIYQRVSFFLCWHTQKVWLMWPPWQVHTWLQTCGRSLYNTLSIWTLNVLGPCPMTRLSTQIQRISILTGFSMTMACWMKTTWWTLHLGFDDAYVPVCIYTMWWALSVVHACAIFTFIRTTCCRCIALCFYHHNACDTQVWCCKRCPRQ